ncbi:glutamine--fructose-6-phosphate transaminase (isomerizing) [Candidatus Falkowbacteria bacterium]|nr:glutamine--fructose-6-phosphate transaminase (isomerizing) [Candidatus Falkowbacteria bacterium]
MCGIIGYIGQKKATPILIQGLRHLEYRGYDSAGLAVREDGKIKCVKEVGRIDNLANKLKQSDLEGTIGIAHTRWATHGGVTQKNTHPHFSCDKKIHLVHNGIIENYKEIKNSLPGHKFVSETDSEVLAHLIEKEYKNNGNLRIAVEKALSQVRGTYGIAVIAEDEPQKIITARLGSPIVIGIGENEYFIASDTTPILPYTKKIVFLDDGEIAEITKDNIQIFNIKDEEIKKPIEKIQWDNKSTGKQGFAHYMLKEIYDQPSVFEDAIRGRIKLEEGTAILGGINMDNYQMRHIDRVIFIACGTAFHAGLVGKYIFEKLVNIPTEANIASEYRYSNPTIGENTLVFAVSQSGETIDTLAAIREAKQKGAFVRGIINVVGSTIARETDGGTYIHAGPELAVASTKAYTNMIAVMILYALQFGRLRKLTVIQGQEIIKALQNIPAQMETILKQSDKIKNISEKYKNFKNFFFLGRGLNYPVALEGSLKLKEITYIHSEAYPGGEMKHGPISLISENFPIISPITKNDLYEKMKSNLEEAKARKSPILAIATEADESIKDLADDIIYVPQTLNILEPLLNTIPLQLFAYHMAVTLGRDVDKPRNLAKSVTVE